MKSKTAAVFLRILVPLYIYIIWAIINFFSGLGLKAAFFFILTLIVYYLFLLLGGLFKLDLLYRFYSIGESYFDKKIDWDNISEVRRMWTPAIILAICVAAMVVLLLWQKPFSV